MTRSIENTNGQVVPAGGGAGEPEAGAAAELALGDYVPSVPCWFAPPARVEPAAPVVPTKREVAEIRGKQVAPTGDGALLIPIVAGSTLGLLLNGQPVWLMAGVSAVGIGICLGASKLPINLRRRKPQPIPGCVPIRCANAECGHHLDQAPLQFVQAHPAPLCPRCQRDGVRVELLPDAPAGAIVEGDRK